jgi:hypothetical protein
MTLFEIATAIILLTAPPDSLELSDPAATHQLAAPAMRQVALQWEILDARETDYLKHAQDFASDLKLLQGRVEELRHAPPLADAYRFPSRELVNDMLAFNRTYRDGINTRLDLDMIHADELRNILGETDFLYRVYDSVRDARCEYFFITYRRQALAQLRELVGVQTYYTAQLPPHVPLWRIPEER